MICTECEATWLSTLLPISLLNWFLFHWILLSHVAALMHPSHFIWCRKKIYSFLHWKSIPTKGNKFRVDCISMPTPFFYHRKSFRTLPGPGFRGHICLLKGLYTLWELPKFNQNKLYKPKSWMISCTVSNWHLLMSPKLAGKNLSKAPPYIGHESWRTSFRPAKQTKKKTSSLAISSGTQFHCLSACKQFLKKNCAKFAIKTKA